MIVVFSLFSFLFYKIMKGYVKSAFGKKWLNSWTNKFYFWQSLVFMSTAGTGIVLYLLKVGNVLTF